MNKLILASVIVAIGSYVTAPTASADTSKRHGSKHHHSKHHHVRHHHARHHHKSRYHYVDNGDNQDKPLIVSWYGAKFHGKRTANGERYDMYAMTAASRTLPLSSYAQVTNLRNNRSVIVRINDRGPASNHRALDLSYSAAQELGIQGTAPVKITPLGNDVNLTEANIKEPG